MASLFWTIATSDLALIIDGIILLAALVVGYFPLAKYLPVIGPYVEAAKLVAFAVVAIMSLCVGYRLADESAELRQVKTDLAFSQLQLDAQKASADEAQKLREQAEQAAETANQKVSDYEARLAAQPKQPQGCNCILDPDDVRSLHDIAK